MTNLENVTDALLDELAEIRERLIAGDYESEQTRLWLESRMKTLEAWERACFGAAG